MRSVRQTETDYGGQVETTQPVPSAERFGCVSLVGKMTPNYHAPLVTRLMCIPRF